MRQTWLAGVLAIGLLGSTLPAQAAEVRIGSVTTSVSSGEGGISADLFAQLLDILLEGLKKQQQQQEQQQRARVIVPTGYEVTGITNLGMFGGDGATSSTVTSLGDGRWEITVDSTLDAESLEDLQCQRGGCGGDYLLGTLLLSALDPPGSILLSTDGLASDVPAPLPEVTIESVEFLLAGQVAVHCGAGGDCVANSVPVPGSLPLAMLALGGLALRRSRHRA